MRNKVESVSDDDLNAFIDNQITPARRAAVKAFLADNPAIEARVMADIRNRDGLRMLAPLPSVPLSLEATLQDLQWPIARKYATRLLPQMAAMTILLGIGWIASDGWDVVSGEEALATSETSEANEIWSCLLDAGDDLI